ncbi:SRPBCC domain-containing protein [Chitinophaga pinensis]|uniref:Activator of Hsp90 ATPase 1 family protein n=1 Tax=Chitinophaga pinensis (strain ATCC 43595 / DSM 2588 / LMG 13176 / NBRC 15968 / NCIMB 11800 / UQM 2034) TaxID=485918 RepID=A0A979G7E0_CHIPD|nr:SRPBCC domain-containing protein [Chitinophaga pinensis]ACU62264.1 Activator of Hsp90 ATPase 1 family protein [Chitinophaga pinensis DSM 2588]
MEAKTKVHAEDGRQEVIITRDFDLPVELLFTAYVEPEIIEQWMNTKVLKLENQKYGSWEFQTSDPKGNVVFTANGVYHEFIPNEKITRTFEMDNMSLGAQLEFLEFRKLSDDTSRLTMHVVYKSVAVRDQLMQLPFRQGINMAHNKLQEIVNKLKTSHHE